MWRPEKSGGGSCHLKSDKGKTWGSKGAFYGPRCCNAAPAPAPPPPGGAGWGVVAMAALGACSALYWLAGVVWSRRREHRWSHPHAAWWGELPGLVLDVSADPNSGCLRRSDL